MAEVEYAFLANEAHASTRGFAMHDALGVGFSDSEADRFPATLKTVAFVSKILFAVEEAGKSHHVRVEIWDADARVMEYDERDFVPQLVAYDATRASAFNVAFNFADLQFPRQGRYAFHLFVEGQDLSSTFPNQAT